MTHDVDYDYPFAKDEQGISHLPGNMTMDGDLYVLDNGKYLPRGMYRTENGAHLIYEPSQLSPFASMLHSFS